MTYAALANSVGKQAVQIVELQLDTCSLVYGQSPCQALLNVTGTTQCFNTFATCQSPGTYTRRTKKYRFSTTRVSGMQQPGDPPIFPTLMSLKTDPTVLTPGKGLGVRSSVTCTIQDHPWTDSGMDPYLATRSSSDQTYDDSITYDSAFTYDGGRISPSPDHRGTFWGKFLKRNKYYQNRYLVVYTGFLNPDGSYDAANFVSRKYIITNMAGPNPNGTVEITAKDPLKLADDDRYKWPKISAAKLAVDALSTDLTIQLSDPSAEFGPWWAGAQRYFRVKDEIMLATALAGASTLNCYQGISLSIDFGPTGYSTPANSAPVSYTITSGTIAPGLSLNTSTGDITGTPTTVGAYAITVTGTNGFGSGSVVITINVLAQLPSPVITSDTTDIIYTQSGSPFTYTATATQSPLFTATNLPPGLSINTTTGVISGTTSYTGVILIQITATNFFGSVTSVLTVVFYAALLPPQVLNDTHTIMTTLTGGFWRLQIVATNSPTSYAATGLPPGVSLNTSTGLISGNPTTAGEYFIVMSATNSAGTSSSQTVTVVVNATVSSPAMCDSTGIVTLTVTRATMPAFYDAAFCSPSTHKTGETVQWCWLYNNAPVYDVVYQLLTRVAGIDPAFLPYNTWKATINAGGFSYLNFSTLLVKPIGLKQLLQEMTELSVLIWWHERDQVILMKGLSFQQVANPNFTDFNNIIDGSVSVQDDSTNLTTEWWLYYNMTWPLANMRLLDTYSIQDVRVVLDKESANAYARPVIRALSTRWLYATNPSAVAGIATVMLNQYQDVRKLITWMADPKDDNWWVGDTVSVQTRYVQDVKGDPLAKNYLITQVEELFDDSGYKLRYTGMELYSFNRTGVIDNPPAGLTTPPGSGPYATATDAAKATYVFMGYPIPFGESHGFFPDGTNNYTMS